MRNARLLRLLATTAFLCAFSPTRALPATSGSQARAVSIDDFGYLDTSDEPTDQAAAHQRRLQAFMAALRGDIGADARLQLVPSSCAPTCASEGPALVERLHAASKDGAEILIVGNIHKMSTLVQWARTVAIDTASNRVVLDKLFTFRGDSDEAWQRAESFVAEELRAGLAGGGASPTPAAAPAPVKLAVFPFELDDASAAAETTGETASDATDLADTTDAVRQLLAQTGRYEIVDVSAAGADAAKAQAGGQAGTEAKINALHDCGGCDAQIALRSGADQSLVGVIRRISRTEYIVGFQVRDARSGTVLANADSGLRMGANYSWSRGATRLVRDRLLEGGGRQ